ncbi:glycosyltransferase family 39 protein [Flexivirga alba]|uniref:Glycosyltransferase family 39 protein n=1 Tax=Flexivirga alba TaxID=702742 RepID=A0ABW2ALH4_9MICO
MTGRAERYGSRRAAAYALALFVVIRLLGVVVLDVVLRVRDAGSLHHMLTRYDGQWYAGIAEHGYGTTIAAHDGLHSDYAFFPLLPLLERAVHTVIQLPFVDLGMAINWLASLAAAAGVYAATERVTDRRTATITTVLWATYPYAIVLSMSYTEGLLCALAAWALWAVADRRWLLAGVLAALAGLTRPTGAAVVAAVCVAALVAGLRGGASWRRVVPTIAIAPLGLIGYLAYVAVRRHELMGYFHATEGWARSWDSGRYFADWVWGLVRAGGLESAKGLGVVVLLLAMVWLIWQGVRDGLPVGFTVFSVVLLLMTIGTSGYFGSRPRYLLPVFTLLIPLAARLARFRLAARIPIAVLLAIGMAVIGGYALTTGAP